MDWESEEGIFILVEFLKEPPRNWAHGQKHLGQFDLTLLPLDRMVPLNLELTQESDSFHGNTQNDGRPV